MADVPSVSSKPASSGSAPGLSNVAVQKAPPQLTAPAQPVQVEGKVVSSNPQAQQITIQTPQGQVVVQSATPLPPETPVSVSFYAANAQARATISVMKQEAARARVTENMAAPQGQKVPPPPPLQEGSTVRALAMPEASLPPVALQQLAAALQTLKETGLQNVQLPLPQDVLEEMLAAKDMRAFLDKLPEALLKNLFDFMAARQAGEEKPPGILRQLLAAYSPQKPVSPAGDPVPDTPEDSLLRIMRLPIPGQKAETLAAAEAKPSAFSPLASAESALTASLGGEKFSGFSALLRQFLPQALRGESPAPQNVFNLHILKILPPGAGAEEVQAVLKAMPSGAQVAEVGMTTSGGRPILQAAGRNFVMTSAADVPPQSKVVFTAAPLTPEEVVQQGLFATAEGEWPALQEALQSLPLSSPAAQALHNTLPTPSMQLAPAALFFLAALRSGDIGNWLGQNTLQALKQAGKKGLVDALSGDFDKLAAQSKETLPGGWKMISIPLRHDEQVSQMQFYVRRQQDEKGEEREGGGKPATRFILNLGLSRMGALQLDGFIHRKSFDMVLRTEERLPFDMRQELMKRFAAGLDQVGMQGGISFQTRQQGWMVPEAANTAAEA